MKVRGWVTVENKGLQQIHEKMLYIANHWGSTNQNQKKYYHTLIRMAAIKKTSNKC